MAMRRIFSNKIVRFFLILGVVLTLSYLVSDFLGFTATGFDDPTVIANRNFYINTGIYSAVILILFFMFSFGLKKGDEKYGNSIAFASQGEFPHLPLFKRFTYFQLAWIFLILFLILGLLNFNALPESRTYTGIGVLEAQQFTATESAIYSNLLVPGSENLAFAAFLGSIMILLGFFARKFRWSPATFMVLVFIFLTVGAIIFGVGNHNLRYGGSEVALRTVAFFWGIGGLLTAMTGSFLPFWFMHIVNNMYFIFGQIFSNDANNIIFTMVIFFLIAIYLFTYRGRLFGETTARIEEDL